VRLVAAFGRFASLAPPEPPLQSYARQPARRVLDGLEISRECVAQLAREAAAIGARTAVLLMPARFQVDEGDYGRLRATVEASGGALERDAASDRFNQALASLPVPRLDALPALRSALPGPDLFFQHTVHLTPRGHEVVAAALERFLRQAGLVDEGPAEPAAPASRPGR
jgi:hypothetical protein